MADPDKTYMDRARQLVQDAKIRADSTKRQVAWANYWTPATKTRLKATFGGGLAASTASVVAVIGATVGGVALGVATAGIGPAVGIAVTYMATKIGSEFKYSKASKALKDSLAAQEAADHFEIDDPNMLLPAVMKVVKKYTRVERRATQLKTDTKTAVFWNAVYTVRHPVTGLRSFAKKHGMAKTGQEKFKENGPASTDPELSDRLFELRYYGQMLFNYVNRIIEEIAIQKRDRVLQMCQLVYSHVVRQVHYTGNHENCEKCYGMDSALQHALAEVEKQVKRMRLSAQAAASRLQMQADLDANADAFADQVQPGMRQLVNARRLRYNLSQLIPVEVEDRQRNLTTNVNRVIDEGRLWVARGAAEVGPHLTEAPVDMASESVSSLQPLPLNVVGSVLAVELTTTIKNRLTRRAVLKREAHFMQLVAEQKQAQDEALADFQSLVKSSHIINRADRVAVKCTSYIQKLTRIQDSLAGAFQNLERARGWQQSVYASCDEAYEVVYGVNYFFRNCEKFIAFLVFLEAILIQIDREVARMVPGVAVGDIIRIRPGDAGWPKPKTVT